MLGWATGKLELIRFTMARTWGKPPPSFPLIIYFVLLHEAQHPNDILSRDSQVGVLKFSQLGFPRLCRPVILCVDLRLGWRLKQSYSPCQELFNGMLQGTYTWGNWGDSWFLMVDNQIANLTLDLSFGHNLCFRCPNGSCEPILDIYVLRVLQWYKKILNPLNFNHFMKI